MLVKRWCEHTTKADIVIGRDIPSPAFARLLAHIMIIEPIDDDRDALVRLAGTAIRARYGAEASGKHLSDLYAPLVLQQHLAQLRCVRSSAEPLILEVTIPREDAVPLVFDKVIFRALARDQAQMWNVVGVFVRNV
ncbi:MAG: PAS domain-containing protein [Alphaproteobacteria bacterium]|nr:PAS domain-containing protein [Alphaproteobacteria bacterium]MDE2496038.1 PAS domain-containing protein [Alphaproteobacteria bacterium]